MLLSTCNVWPSGIGLGGSGIPPRILYSNFLPEVSIPLVTASVSYFEWLRACQRQATLHGESHEHQRHHARPGIEKLLLTCLSCLR